MQSTSKISSIDVHIIQHPIFHRDISKLLDQLADEPVVVHLVEGEPRNIGAGRAKGFTKGKEELVSYVDDDDEIVPGIFSKILNLFNTEQEIDAVCTREIMRTPKEDVESFHGFKYYDLRHSMRLHHLAVFKRDIVTPHLDKISQLPDGSEHSLWMYILLAGKLIRHLPEVGYVWNIHPEHSKCLNIPKPQAVFDLHNLVHSRAQAKRKFLTRTNPLL